MKRFRSFSLRSAVQNTLSNPQSRLLLLFGFEGLLLQYAVSLNSIGNNLYATNLGATDTQIGLVTTIPNLAAVLLMIPCGILSNRTRCSRTVPMVLLLIMGGAYFGLGTVPAIGKDPMASYFFFLAMTTGGIALYNAQWQTFFADAVHLDQRHQAFAVRNRCMFLIGIFVPLLCGSLMALRPDTEGKLWVLRVFYYLAGACMIGQALLLRRIPCPLRREEDRGEKMGLALFRQALGHMFGHRAFRSFFAAILLFYFAWHIDWSLWYIAEIQYAGMNEAQLSLFQALCSTCQMLSIGFFTRLCREKSEHYVFLFACLGLFLCPVMVATMLFLPMGARVPYFILLGLIGNIPQGMISMCTVQMLLQVTPVKNRALIVSIYTLFITLSNSLLPLLGVWLYTCLGANARALGLICVFVAIARAGVVLIMTGRYRRLKKSGDLFRPLA